eukprot:TRINITY_DN8378_c0_g3_i3.p1 TRINITY_DN8378_c0_g3~~TRINITY_DN8378_c0_g3_i3.p1  ORF type:complete len:218 (+),score=10.20 TRINITY_DN8378_c0_g3_i3:491-1144(+)
MIALIYINSPLICLAKLILKMKRSFDSSTKCRTDFINRFRGRIYMISKSGNFSLLKPLKALPHRNTQSYTSNSHESSPVSKVTKTPVQFGENLRSVLKHKHAKHNTIGDIVSIHNKIDYLFAPKIFSEQRANNINTDGKYNYRTRRIRLFNTNVTNLDYESKAVRRYKYKTGALLVKELRGNVLENLAGSGKSKQHFVFKASSKESTLKDHSPEHFW